MRGHSSFPLAGCTADDALLIPDAGAGGSDSRRQRQPLGTVAGLPVDKQLSLANLAGPVEGVVRDKWKAARTSTPPARRTRCGSRAYLVALDRHIWQLEFYRRVSEGLPVGDPLRLLPRHHRPRHQLPPHRPRPHRRRRVRRPPPRPRQGRPRRLRRRRDPRRSGRSGARRKSRSPRAWPASPPPPSPTGPASTRSPSPGSRPTSSRTAPTGTSPTSSSSTPPGPPLQRLRTPTRHPRQARRTLEQDLFRFAPADPATTTTGYPMLASARHDGGPSKGPPNPPGSSARAAARRRMADKKSALLASTGGYLAAHEADAVACSRASASAPAAGPSTPRCRATGHSTGGERSPPVAQRPRDLLARVHRRSTRLRGGDAVG